MNAPHKILTSIVVLVAGTACSAGGASVPGAVLDEVRAMANEDQRWENLVVDRDPATKEPGFFDRKRELQDRNAERCREIFERHGLLSSGRVGEEVAGDFWVLVQHADRHVDFQAAVLAAMEESPDSGVDPRERALLVDRVRVNTGRGQLYGTQVAYDKETGRAEPKPLESAAGVDERRASAGLEPLRTYMNDMCELHFAMNSAVYAEQGITEPYVYPEGWAAWPEVEESAPDE